MIKTGICHPDLVRLLSSLGHTDQIMIADAGLPIPKGVERVDLAWKRNEPRLVPVLTELLKTMVIQKAYLAEEIKTEAPPQLYQEILSLLKDIPITYIPHAELKAMSGRVRGIIRTGEFSPYPNVILESGCAF